MSFCSKCGAQLNPDDRFCQSCGAPVNAEPAARPAAARVQTEEISSGDKWLSVLAYCGPLVFVPMFVRQDSDFVQYHVHQGFNLFVFYVALMLGRWTLGIIPYVGTYFFRYVFDIASIIIGVFSIIGIVNSLRGVKRPLPWFGSKLDLLKTWFHK